MTTVASVVGKDFSGTWKIRDKKIITTATNVDTPIPIWKHVIPRWLNVVDKVIDSYHEVLAIDSNSIEVIATSRERETWYKM